MRLKSTTGDDFDKVGASQCHPGTGNVRVITHWKKRWQRERENEKALVPGVGLSTDSPPPEPFGPDLCCPVAWQLYIIYCITVQPLNSRHSHSTADYCSQTGQAESCSSVSAPEERKRRRGAQSPGLILISRWASKRACLFVRTQSLG